MASPRLGVDYAVGVTEASKSALAEVVTALGRYRETLVLIGGWAPYFILEQFGRPQMEFDHVGSIDIDIVVDPSVIDVDQYATIVELLNARGYEPAEDSLFQFEKDIISPLDGKGYRVRVDFLTPQPLRGQGQAHRHRRVQRDLKARILPGAEVALEHSFMYQLQAQLPGDGIVEVELRVTDVVGALSLKGIAIGERYAEKDAYDIYALCAYYQDGPPSVAEAFRPFLHQDPIQRGLRAVAARFRAVEAEGPAWVAAFLSEGDRDRVERITRDAYMVVGETLHLLGIGKRGT
ncbi:MAG: hypothetical protein ACE5FB_05010 [Candidatus Binatia bacterium]